MLIRHRRNYVANCRENRFSIETLEGRLMLAAHIVGSSTVYATIQAAVNAASAGATINVDAGTYPEEVTISKTLTLRGAEAGVDARTRAGGSSAVESVVSGAVSGSTHSCAFYINANDVVIDGFTVQGETSGSSSTGAGIVIAPSHAGTHVINTIMQDNVAGLFLANNSSTDAALIQYDYFANNNSAGNNSGRGIYTDGGVSGGNLTNVTIDSNTFVNNYGTDGIEAACAFQAGSAGEQSNIRITNNVMAGNGKATLFFNTTGVVIENNTITGCIDQGSGALRFEGDDHNVTIMYNTADYNIAPALAVDAKGTPGDNSGFVVNDNNFYDNDTASTPALSVVFNGGNYTGSFDVRDNWWGRSSGPSVDGPGAGDGVSAATLTTTGNVETWSLVSGGGELISPWLTSPYNSSTPTLPTAPTGLAAVVVSSTQVNLTWTDTAPGIETGFLIQRSTNGAAYTQIGTTAIGVTSYHDITATAGTSYAYRVLATSAAGNSPASAVASATTPASNSITTYISTLPWVSATVGYGSIRKNASINGNPLALRGTVYAEGIGTHAVSQIVYNLGEAYTNFISAVGVDDEVTPEGGTGSVDFQVIGDGKVLFDSGVVTNFSPVVTLNVNVTGVQQLTLLASNGVAGSIDYDHADWAGARLLSQPAAPATPTGLAAAALSGSQIKLTWTNSTIDQTAIAIDRSTDGTTFVNIASNVSPTAASYTDTSLSASTKYYYRIRAVNAVGASPNTAVVNATTLAAASVATYLSDLTPVSATVGWGSIQKDKSVGGNTITLRGMTYAKGIGTHAVSQIVFNLAGQYSTFISDVGIDDEENGKGIGSVDFQVIGDGKVLFDSGVLTNASPIVNIDVSVIGVQTLTLLATNGVPNSIDYDHADWAGARVI